MADPILIKRVVDSIKEHGRGRAVAMYGKHADIQSEIEKAGFPVKKIFTGNLELLADKALGCTDFREMKGQAEKYYVVIPFFLPDGGIKQKEIMQSYGFQEIKDYIFYPIDIILEGISSYKDQSGNTVECKSKNVTVKLLGGCSGNHIVIGQVNKAEGRLLITVKGENSAIHIEDNSKFLQDNFISIQSECKVSIQSGCSLTRVEILCFEHCSVCLERNCSFSGRARFYIHPFSNVVIGKDAMFSFDVLVQTGDGHSIFNLKTGENVNSNLQKQNSNGYLSEIALGEHIWIGREAVILAGMGKTELGEGSIVGLRSVVKGKFPNNCVIAGVPAKVIKTDVAWSRKNRSDNLEDCGGYTKFTEEC